MKVHKAIVIGSSAGGINALEKILPILPKDFPFAVIVIQHISPNSENYFSSHLNKLCFLTVKEADEKEKILTGKVYTAPPGYHLLIERDFTFSLSVDPLVNYARPSIDVLFESAAEAYQKDLIGIILTGANSDGAEGLKLIKKYGGLTIVQDPLAAKSPEMPAAAIKTAQIDHILKLEQIGLFLTEIQNSSFGSKKYERSQ